MRKIYYKQIVESVSELCRAANVFLGDDVVVALKEALNKEESLVGKECLAGLIENAKIAVDEQMPICQDTGMAVVFAEYGQEIIIEGGDFTTAINEGVEQGYQLGYLRKSVVKDPFDRINTGDNTPAVIHTKIVLGDKLKLTVVPKGFGSENMSRLKMLTPAQGITGVMDFIIETVRMAGANPCPPIVVGVGIGGTMEKAAIMAKEALLRDVGTFNHSEEIAKLEIEALEKINMLGIGPMGLGGRCTALAVHINTFPTHIAGLPVAININCHVTRHKTKII